MIRTGGSKRRRCVAHLNQSFLYLFSTTHIHHIARDSCFPSFLWATLHVQWNINGFVSGPTDARCQHSFLVFFIRSDFVVSHKARNCNIFLSFFAFFLSLFCAFVGQMLLHKQRNPIVSQRHCSTVSQSEMGMPSAFTA